MRQCRLCRSTQLQMVTDFGRLSMTSQFVPDDGPAPYLQAISWQQCGTCGVVQLTEAPPLEQIRPRFDWMAYREPDSHLPQSAGDLVREGELEDSHRVFGLSDEELPLLKRLGIPRIQVLDPRQDLGITLPRFGRETIQANWTVERARQAAERYGRADAFIALYSLEHTHDAAQFLAACREFLKPGGILLVEVPDCARAFRQVDLTVIWEEHTLYFTEGSLQSGLQAAGFERLHFRRVPGLIEDQLVWIGRSGNVPELPGSADAANCEDGVQHFASQWPHRREAFRKWAAGIRAAKGRLAVFGAGHRACTLIDVTGLAEFVDCVIDDAPEKQTLRFPTGRLPICGSASLVDRGITDCLLVVNPEVEDRIVSRQQEFLARGGRFVSCYPGSSRALRWP